MTDADDLRLAFDVSDRAARLALDYFESGVAATLKADGTPVTEADRAVERAIREALALARPTDALLGEELGRRGESDRVWIIDPIDGTSSFTRRDPNWRVHLVLEVAGQSEIAVVTAPALGRRWWATRGGGAFESSWPGVPGQWPRPGEPGEPGEAGEAGGPAGATRLAVSTTSAVAGARLDALDDPSRARFPPGAVRPPASPLPLVALIHGEIDAFLAERYHIWDHAPWILLVEEAGGRFTDPTGGRAGDQGGGLYSNANLHGQLLAALGYPTRP